MIILNTSKLIEIFVQVDDFMQEFEPFCQEKLLGHQTWRGQMSQSEMMAIVIFFHLSGIRCFSWYYKEIVLKWLRTYFPKAYTYEHFVARMPAIQLELYVFLHLHRMGQPTEANYIDSKPLEVCHVKREKQHKVFRGLAQKGRTSKGYFFGFKLHVLSNQKGELLRLALSSGNVADNNARILIFLLDYLTGKVYGDKGYLTRLKSYFETRGIKIISKVRKNMKKPTLTAQESYYLRKRGLIETIFDQLVHICQIEHSRHRSPKNFLVNLWSGLIAYTYLEKLPQIQEYSPKKLKAAEVVLY